MKVLIITNLFPPEVLGGYEILCQQVCRQLRAQGHEVTVLTSASSQPDRRPWVRRTLKLFLPFASPSQGRYRARQLAAFVHNRRATRELLELQRPDVVFVWSQRRLTLACALAAQQAGYPVVYTFNDAYLEFYKPFKLCGPLSLKGLDLKHSTCISHRLKDILLKAELPLRSSRVIHQGVPLSQYPLKASPGAQLQRLLYVGQLHPYKGVHTAIEAAHRCRLSLTIVGAGPDDYCQRLQRQAAAGPAQIGFAGKLASTELGQVYREHDLLVFPSIWEEPFGLTHLEAMASGLPVVSTLSGGQAEFLRPGENCLSFEGGQVEQLADCLNRLRVDQPLRRRLAMAGRTTVVEHYNLGRYCDDLQQLLSEAA